MPAVNYDELRGLKRCFETCEALRDEEERLRVILQGNDEDNGAWKCVLRSQAYNVALDSIAALINDNLAGKAI